MSDAAALATDIHVLSRRQALFISYLLCVLVDLTVLNLFDEFWDKVVIESFSVSILTALLLQIMLRVTLKLEHKAAAYFKDQGGDHATAKRLTATWLILFASKFVILGAIHLIFGDMVNFTGIVPFIIVVVVLLSSELLVSRVYGLLAEPGADGKRRNIGSAEDA